MLTLSRAGALALAGALVFGAPLSAQTVPVPPIAPATGPRPVPGPVYEIPGFTDAVKRGTRTRSGRPGPGYWVQHARYDIDASIDVAANRVSGSERVTYLNNSPDTLRRLAVHLRQNAFAAGNPRNQTAFITGGVTLGRVAVTGTDISAHSSGVNVVPITSIAHET